MGALEAPQDRHRQEPPEQNRQTGTMAELGTLEAMAVQGALKAMVEQGALGTMAELGALGTMAELGALGTMAELGALGTMAELGALEAMADGLRGPRPRPPRPGPYSRNPTTPPPPKKNFHGEVRGYQEPSRAKQTGQYKTRRDSPPGPDRQDRTRRQESPPGPDRQDRTSHNDRKALQDQTDKTGHPTGTRSPPGLARRLRLPLGMIRSQGPSATASTSATRGQAARMASMATTRGAAPDESPWTRQGS